MLAELDVVEKVDIRLWLCLNAIRFKRVVFVNDNYYVEADNPKDRVEIAEFRRLLREGYLKFKARNAYTITKPGLAAWEGGPAGQLIGGRCCTCSGMSTNLRPVLNGRKFQFHCEGCYVNH